MDGWVEKGVRERLKTMEANKKGKEISIDNIREVEMASGQTKEIPMFPL